jgi:hypothetical protein
MHATEMIDKTIGKACQSIHKVRFVVLKNAAEAATSSRCLSVTGLGRVVRAKDEKVGIKRMDRLMGNCKLHTQLPTVYHAMARWRLNKDVRPNILVDWSTLKTDNSLHLLSASLPSLGQSLPLYTRRCIPSRY